MRQTTFRLAALLGITCIAGCSFTTQLHYDPIVTDPETPEAAVALTVVDARQPNYGGNEKTEIGAVRGGFGNPFPVYDSDARKVPLLMQAATADALAQSRIAVQADSSRTLVVTVTKFWIDGYVGYGASITAQCDLKDEHGAVLWSATASGSGGGVAWWGPTGHIQPTFHRS